MIVDNAAYSFAYQLTSGIPIISWHDDRLDTELLCLIEFLRKLSTAPDIRDILQESFQLDSYYEDYSDEFSGK